MKNHTIKISVSAKRGDNQAACFLVRQSHPYPDTEGVCGSLRWRNAGGIFPAYGREFTGIGNEYIFELLRSDIAAESVPYDYNRTHLAGYVEYQNTAINPGALVFRGASLGEMSIRLELGTWEQVTIRVRGGDFPSDSERAFIMVQILPALRAYVVEHKGELYADAVRGVELRFSDYLEKLRATLGELEVQAGHAVVKLREFAKGGVS